MTMSARELFVRHPDNPIPAADCLNRLAG